MEDSIFGSSKTSDFSDPDKLYGHKDLEAFARSLGMDYNEFIKINNKNAEVIKRHKLQNKDLNDRY